MEASEVTSAGSDGVSSSGIPGRYIIVSFSSSGCIAVLKTSKLLTGIGSLESVILAVKVGTLR